MPHSACLRLTAPCAAALDTPTCRARFCASSAACCAACAAARCASCSRSCSRCCRANSSIFCFMLSALRRRNSQSGLVAEAAVQRRRAADRRRGAVEGSSARRLAAAAPSSSVERCWVPASCCCISKGTSVGLAGGRRFTGAPLATSRAVWRCETKLRRSIMRLAIRADGPQLTVQAAAPVDSRPAIANAKHIAQ